jgi:hypothetical protein
MEFCARVPYLLRMRLARTPSVLALCALSACASRQTDSTVTPVRAARAAVPDAGPIAAPLPAPDTALPQRAPLRATVDLRLLEPMVRSLIEQTPFGRRLRSLVEPHAQSGNADPAQGFARALGFDPARPMLAAIAPLSEGSANTVRRIDALRRGGCTAAQFVEAFGAEGFSARGRVVFPTTDGERAVATLDAMLSSAMTAAQNPPNGIAHLYINQHNGTAAALVRASDSVVLEVLLGIGASVGVEAYARRELGALRARPAELPSAPATTPLLETDGALAVVSFAPTELTDAAFGFNARAVAAAIASVAEVDPAAASALVAEGLRESARVFELAADAQGRAFFSRVDVRVAGEPDAIIVRASARIGPAANAVPPAWGAAARSSVMASTANVHADADVAFLASWTLPGDRDATPWHERASSSRTLFAEAGAAGSVIAMPYGPILAARSLAAEALPRSPAHRAALLSIVERMGTVTPATPASPPAQYFLLSESTTAARAACALSATPRCAASERLVLDGPPAAHPVARIARLSRVGRRFVLWTADDASAVRAPFVPAVSLGPSHGPLSVEVDVGATLRALELSPSALARLGRYRFELARDADVLSFDLRPAR